MDAFKIDPYIRVAGASIVAAKTSVRRRVIFDYELIYIEDGEFILMYNEQTYICGSDIFIFLRPGVPHSFTGVERDLSQPHIHFDLMYASDSAQVPVSFKDIDAFDSRELKQIREDLFLAYPKTPFVTFSDKEKVLRLFYDVICEPRKGSLLERKAKFMQIIDMMIQDNFPDFFSQSDNVYGIEKQIKDYIDAGQGFASSLDDMAKQFNFNKFYLERRFKEHYHISLIAYRNKKRMELAKAMLKKETVSAVAENLGFSSIYVFSRAYKNHFGISPTKTKEENL